jgi:hypothetical protein
LQKESLRRQNIHLNNILRGLREGVRNGSGSFVNCPTMTNLNPVKFRRI